jgi:hypothetical protein
MKRANVSAKKTCPDRLSIGKAAEFVRRPELYVVLHTGPAPDRQSVATITVDAQSAYAVYKGKATAAEAHEAGPVYSAGAGGPLAIPTGRVFVRLEEGMSPEKMRPAFSAAGFEIERTLPYAPNAAWLRPLDGGAAQALERLGDLEKTHDVVHVEPQMLMERAKR